MPIAVPSLRLRLVTVGLALATAGLIAIAAQRATTHPSPIPSEPPEVPVVREELLGDWRELFGEARLVLVEDGMVVRERGCSYQLAPWGATREWVTGSHVPSAWSGLAAPLAVRWRYRFDGDVLVIELVPGVERRFVLNGVHIHCFRDFDTRPECDL